MKDWKKLKASLALATALAMLLSLSAPALAAHSSGTDADSGAFGEEALSGTEPAEDGVPGTEETTVLADADSDGADYNLSETSTVKIEEDGEYVITGSSDDGSITVKKGVTATLTLQDVTLTSATAGNAPLTCNKGSDVTLVIVGTVTLTDDEDPNDSASEGAAIKVKAGGSLTITGGGTLNVVGNCKNGIKGAGASFEDDGSVEYQGTKVVIAGAAVNVTASNNGVACDNAVEITGGTLHITAGNDGVKAEPDDDDTVSAGTVTVSGGAVTIETTGADGGDGIQATGDLTVTGGTLDITAMGGYNSKTFDEDTMSAKGLKSDGNILISGGAFTLNCADDAVHADGDVTITGGEFTIRSGDDGIHADGALTIGEAGSDSGPDILISQSVEGLEGATVNLYSGSADVTASDDGVNAANSDLTGYTYQLNIAGGAWLIDAAADCLDSNGNLTVTGGQTVLYGPLSSPEVALDYVGTFTLTGGSILAAGQTSISDAAEAGSSTTAVGVQFTGVSVRSGTAIAVQDSAGNTVADAAGRKSASWVWYADSDMAAGDSYTLLLDNAAAGTATAAALTSGGPGGGGTPGTPPDGGNVPGGGTPGTPPDGGNVPGGGTPGTPPDGGNVPGGGGTPGTPPGGGNVPGGGGTPGTPPDGGNVPGGGTSAGETATPQGCYVATAVYGSYDCPEVWTLRRFRDRVLAKTWYGRLFIRLYYAVSPTAVKLFGKCAWFQNFFRGILDPWVADLQSDGFASTPYNDLPW